jgi:hypothetical protein
VGRACNSGRRLKLPLEVQSVLGSLCRGFITQCKTSKLTSRAMDHAHLAGSSLLQYSYG